ncbi:hypothetical protein ANCDUO_01430 [Ancylostoma duodenale]|uniref:Uncharacterized protein n=1 Tax=Ancylostoma duodenale TaxID=51022 RepID=A0A0C2DE66_9BILA|nr:hypothetical protein ANCDUO_01430 [Ancylostoma duodenale]
MVYDVVGHRQRDADEKNSCHSYTGCRIGDEAIGSDSLSRTQLHTLDDDAAIGSRDNYGVLQCRQRRRLPSSKNTPPSSAQYLGQMPRSPGVPGEPGCPGLPGLPG